MAELPAAVLGVPGSNRNRSEKQARESGGAHAVDHACTSTTLGARPGDALRTGGVAQRVVGPLRGHSWRFGRGGHERR
jgi:hypothetical protein